MNKKRIPWEGKTIGKVEVLSRAPNQGTKCCYYCKCTVCGAEFKSISSYLSKDKKANRYANGCKNCDPRTVPGIKVGVNWTKNPKYESEMRRLDEA